MARAMADAKVMMPVSSPGGASAHGGNSFADLEEEFSGFLTPARPLPGSAALLQPIGADVSQPSIFGPGLADQLSSSRAGLAEVADDDGSSNPAAAAAPIGFLDELSHRVSRHSNNADDIESRVAVQRTSGSGSQPDPLQAELAAKLKRRSALSPDTEPDPGGVVQVYKTSLPSAKPKPVKVPPVKMPKPKPKGSMADTAKSRPVSGAYGFGADFGGGDIVFQSSPGMVPLLEDPAL